MPQLDTTTWSITIMSMILTLFILFQLKISKNHYPHDAEASTKLYYKTPTPWEKKWTKIYSPLSLPQ
uniref:ATP synthase complex subunit 8 n=1 Tax=Manis pentadactyla TaxID=143292 RepID=A0A343RBX0_MANPE|nr:ATP synthase F0 subunit 8 [Manis pentadactyla pentadactyla]ATX69043.1 ATP synthase F0 subunit 8 [Manis pentadactyla]QNL17764.1 ATP synthase F0 subunit 8 [Manis pentadactyla]UIX23008.1 ATP synthase F0 subunit 8 [Manis pentadactyla pentadactyla]